MRTIDYFNLQGITLAQDSYNHDSPQRPPLILIDECGKTRADLSSSYRDKRHINKVWTNTSYRFNILIHLYVQAPINESSYELTRFH